MKPTQPRDRYPWFVRPLPGHFHAVEFGTRHTLRGPVHDAVVGVIFNIAGRYKTKRIENVIKQDKNEIHVYDDGTIVDVYGKQGATVRKDKAELLD